MARELEIKYKLPAPEAFCDRLRDAGAARQQRVQEHNAILDTTDRQLLHRGAGLRLRRETADDGGRRATLTYKGPREFDPRFIAGGFKAREELETVVGQPDELEQLLERLGFQLTIVFEKSRETWHCGACVVTVDELPQLGWFCEIEGPDADTIEGLAQQLALQPDQQVSETYVELTARHGVPTPDGGWQLTF
jgi:adenylate cyclase, class 2